MKSTRSTHAVVQLVEALRHKPKCGRFDSRWCHWNVSLIQSFQPHCGIFPAGKGGCCVGLTTLPTSCVECLEIWEPQPSRKFRFLQGLLYLSARSTLVTTLIIFATSLFRIVGRSSILLSVIFWDITKETEAILSDRPRMFPYFPL